MTAITTPEVIQPNELYALPGKGDGFVQVLNNGLPNGGDCIQLIHATDSERLQLRQPLRSDSHFMATTTGSFPFNKNGLSFWIRPRQDFDGTAVTSAASIRGTQLNNAPILMGVGNPVQPDVNGWGYFGWLIVCSSDGGVPQIQFVQQHRLSGFGSIRMWASSPIVTPVDEWTFVAISNLYSFFVGSGSTSNSYSGRYDVYVNGRLTQTQVPSTSTSANGSGLCPWYNLNADLAHFALGDPTGGNNAARGVGNGPLVDLGQIAFNRYEAAFSTTGPAITDVEAFQLYEAMIYG